MAGVNNYTVFVLELGRLSKIKKVKSLVMVSGVLVLELLGVFNNSKKSLLVVS